MSRTSAKAVDKVVISADFVGKKRTADQLAKLLRPVKDVPLLDLPSDKRWRDAVHAYLEEHKINQEQLAKWIGTSQGVVSNIISDGNRQFHKRHEFVGRIGHAVGIGLPLAARLWLAAERAIDAGHPDVAVAAERFIEVMLENPDDVGAAAKAVIDAMTKKRGA